MQVVESTLATLEARVQDFLAQKRIAVAGVSRTQDGPANLIYRKLKGAGYQVFAVNPHADSFDGDPCYPNLRAIPAALDGVVAVTRPEVTEALVRQCVEAGVPRVWMHQSFARAGSSVSPEAVEFCRAQNTSVIAGGCPMMFCAPVDVGHRCLRWLLRATGGLPE
jgi:uncharacterized protein